MSKRKLTIGSDSDNDIVFKGRYIDPFHALLIEENNQFIIQDLGSTFGVTINGEKVVKPTTLKPSDQVKVGTQILDWQGLNHDDDNTENVTIIDLITPRSIIHKSNLKYLIILIIGSIISVTIGVPLIFDYFGDRIKFPLKSYTYETVIGLLILIGLISLNIIQKVIRGWNK